MSLTWCTVRATCVVDKQIIIITGDPVHNLTDLPTTMQHTAVLHTTMRVDGVLQGCVQFGCGEGHA